MVKLVGQFNVCSHIALGVVGRNASWNGAAKIPLPCVSLHVSIQSVLELELPPTSGTLVVLVIPAALLLAILSTFMALKISTAIGAEMASRVDSFMTLKI